MTTTIDIDKDISDLTPFPATAFEHYMYADDRVELPMTFFIRLTFDGIIEQDRFKDALMQALPRHVLFQSLLNNKSGVRGKNLQWIPLPKTKLPYIDYNCSDAPYVWPSSCKNIDLQKEIGLRIFIRASHQKTTLMMQIHHSSADALGALSFIEDVMSYYHSCTAHLKHFTHESLLNREHFLLTNREVFRRYGKDFGRALKFFSCIPKPMSTAHHSNADDGTNDPMSETVFICGEEFDKIQGYCKRTKITLNDLFLKELFVTLDRFNKGSGKSNDYYRISMPINMRDQSHSNCSSANIVSMCFIDRKRDSVKNESALLRSISEETKAIKKYRLGLALIKTTRKFSHFKGGMNFLVTPRKPLLCYATVVLSNLGRIFKDSKVFGSSTLPSLETVELLPPIRPYTNAAIGVSAFKNKVVIAMHYNGFKISAIEASKFLNDFKTQLLQKS